jgi:hypothetical protein
VPDAPPELALPAAVAACEAAPRLNAGAPGATFVFCAAGFVFAAGVADAIGAVAGFAVESSESAESDEAIDEGPAPAAAAIAAAAIESAVIAAGFSAGADCFPEPGPVRDGPVG